MIDIDDFPIARSFAAHGVEFKKQAGDELVGDCPFTGKSDKFYLNSKTGAWHSKTMGVGGGPTKFLFLTQETYQDVRELPQRLMELAAHRGLPARAFKEWGFGWDGTHYTLGIRDNKGRTRDIRRYEMAKKQMRSTAGCHIGLLGADALAKRPTDPVYLCEGEWDAIAMQWLLTRIGRPGVVLGLPGAGTFKPEWVDWMKGRTVHTLYDADDAGELGEELAYRRLNGHVHGLTFVHWPSELPKGFDTRDWIVYGAVKRDTPKICFERLTKLFQDRPRTARLSTVKKVVKLKKTEDVATRPTTLEEVHECFKKWLFLPNTDAVDVMLAVCFSQQIEGPPLWLFLVAPPGGAKTVTLLSLMKWDGAFLTSSLTPHALVSGANWQGQTDPSLIPRLNGKIFVIKDFTPVFAMRDLDQGEIFGILRDAYDGRCGKIFGNGVERAYESSFSIIAGVTPRIYDLSEGHASLGERFLKFSMSDNLIHASEDEIIHRAIGNVDQNNRVQEELADVVTAFLNTARGPCPTLSPEMERRIVALARFGARIRGTVSKDFRGENIIGRPFAEVGSRLGIQLSKVARSLAWIHGRTEVNEDDYRLVVKIMLDTVSQRQEDLIRAIFKATQNESDWVTSQDLSILTHYPSTTIRRMLDDLLLLQVVVKRGTSFRYAWRLSPYILSAIHAARLYERPEELTRRSHIRFVRIKKRHAPPAQ